MERESAKKIRTFNYTRSCQSNAEMPVNRRFTVSEITLAALFRYKFNEMDNNRCDNS